MKRMVSKLMVGMGVLGAVTAAQGALIASESFNTTTDGAGGTYSTGASGGQLGGAGNNVVIVGNSGFSAGNIWSNNTASVKAQTPALSHSGTTGTTYNGMALISSGNARNSNRLLSAEPATASSYYLSGLVAALNTSSWDNGDQVMMGMMDNISANTSSSATGFHLGMQKTGDKLYLAAFAGGSAYNLVEFTGTATYQIVLKLDVLASGTEKLTAWYAANNATELTQGLVATDVGDIWQNAGSLDTFTVQTKEGASTVGQIGRLDEMRFGTTLGDVTAITTIPEPTTLGLFVISSCAMFFLRRVQH